jgi:hypothetical protein
MSFSSAMFRPSPGRLAGGGGSGCGAFPLSFASAEGVGAVLSGADWPLAGRAGEDGRLLLLGIT